MAAIRIPSYYVDSAGKLIKGNLPSVCVICGNPAIKDVNCSIQSHTSLRRLFSKGLLETLFGKIWGLAASANIKYCVPNRIKLSMCNKHNKPFLMMYYFGIFLIFLTGGIVFLGINGKDTLCGFLGFFLMAIGVFLGLYQKRIYKGLIYYDENKNEFVIPFPSDLFDKELKLPEVIKIPDNLSPDVERFANELKKSRDNKEITLDEYENIVKDLVKLA